MPRFRNFAIYWLGCLLLISGKAGLLAEEITSSERLLPNTTQGFFAISSIEKLSEHWDKTQLGHLMADPAMEPFSKDVRRQFESRWSSVHERLGLSLKDMSSVPGGDVGIGLISCGKTKAALAIVMDVTGKLPEAKEMLAKITETQLKRGGKRTELKLEGYPDVVIQFDLPEPEHKQNATRSTLRNADAAPPCKNSTDDTSKTTAPAAETSQTEAPAFQAPATTETTKEISLKDVSDEETATVEKSETAPVAAEEKEEVKEEEEVEQKENNANVKRVRQAFYCLTGNLLVVADDLDVLKGILGRIGGESDDSLADCKPFQIVMQRCAEDYGDAPPQMRWFLSPVGYAEASRAATPADQRRKGKSILEVMRNQGVGAVKGMGGLADFSSEGFELVHRTAVYAPKPYEMSMKMLVLPNGADFSPQDWVPRDIATYTTFYFDILNGFDNFGPLFDELIGQGTKGAWQEVLDGLKLDPQGPQVDLREDLVKHLGQRVSMLTDYCLPITTTSERLLFAVEVKDTEAVAKAIEKLLKDDQTIERREVAGHVIWEIVGEEEIKMEPPKIEGFGAPPPIAPAQPRKKQFDPWEEEEEERKPLLPHAAVTVCKGHLFVSSHIDFLLKVIAPEKEPDLLRDDVDYQLVTAEIDKFKPEKKCFRFFSRTDEEYRSTYELIRQNKMPESETMLARMLNVLFGDGKDGAPRAQKIDGSQLPDYQVVRRYLGPAGMQVTSEKDGWYLKGFTLSKETE